MDGPAIFNVSFLKEKIYSDAPIIINFMAEDKSKICYLSGDSPCHSPAPHVLLNKLDLNHREFISNQDHTIIHMGEQKYQLIIHPESFEGK